MDFKVGRGLSRRVRAPTPVVFDVEAARTGGQTVAAERLDLNSGPDVEQWAMPEAGNR